MSRGRKGRETPPVASWVLLRSGLGHYGHLSMEQPVTPENSWRPRIAFGVSWALTHWFGLNEFE